MCKGTTHCLFGNWKLMTWKEVGWMRMEMRWEQLTLPGSIFLSFSASSMQPHRHCFPKDFARADRLMYEDKKNKKRQSKQPLTAE